MLKLSFIFGTRPEVIKLAPVIKAFLDCRQTDVKICFTGQHREMVLPLLDFFDLKVDDSLDIMQPGQTLAGLTARSITAVDAYLENRRPDLIFVQGDTTTAMSAATAAFYKKIKIAHVEAGLRTFNRFSPFPEEFNREVISRIADLHFAPTQTAADNLLKEGIEPSVVFVTGNTVIDALLLTRSRLNGAPADKGHPWGKNGKKIILITGHRRENFGTGFENICLAIRELSAKYPDCDFVYPVHLNPNVQEPVNRLLQDLGNVYLVPPMGYVEFTSLMSQSYFILTDSGGIQEEAPALHKPVLVMRDTTERDEAIRAGGAKLVGTNKVDIVGQVSGLIDNGNLYATMSSIVNPFGDGKASEKIVSHTLSRFNLL
ncbi:MAG TPA: UDP-N-acetylglucosamine 2-epimerase (non-hydrolyzing) [Puia sp.]|nr:UDP-N-acetylglucosamine 2-epimerase (non-hydrolyzing) [Puia sp.]